jgi:hypothetical protein
MVFIDPPFHYDLPTQLYEIAFKITYWLYLAIVKTTGYEIAFTPECVAFVIGSLIVGGVGFSIARDAWEIARLTRKIESYKLGP